MHNLPVLPAEEKITNGKSVSTVVKELLNAHDPDTIESLRFEIQKININAPTADVDEEFNKQHSKILSEAAKVFTGELNEYIENVRRLHEQKIDLLNPDAVTGVGWDKAYKEKAKVFIKDFTEWMQQHKHELTALQIFYSQPYRRRELTYTMIKEVLEKLIAEKPTLAPLQIWRCYEQLEKVIGQPKNELIGLVSLLKCHRS
ncbi:MAG: hypothetical protein M3R36_18585 [Bacteroidota bacterium]|nr:hypothetical protein [Bacteroidota bacterium]